MTQPDASRFLLLRNRRSVSPGSASGFGAAKNFCADGLLPVTTPRLKTVPGLTKTTNRRQFLINRHLRMAAGHFQLVPRHVQTVAGHLQTVAGRFEMTNRQLQMVVGRSEMTDRQLLLAAGRLTTAAGRVQMINRRPQTKTWQNTGIKKQLPYPGVGPLFILI